MKIAKIIKNEKLTEDVYRLILESNEPFEFEAGQFITIKIDDQDKPCFRAYSIASSPNDDKKTFELCIKAVEGGRGSVWLNSLDPGEEVTFLGPSGKFTFKTPAEKEVVFIATGTGVAPFRSMIEDQLKKKNTHKITLLFGVRHEKDIFYQKLFQKLASEHENFNFEITISRPENKEWTGNIGRVTTLLEKITTDLSKCESYICGLTDMINSVTEILKEKGCSEESIHFEKYD